MPGRDILVGDESSSVQPSSSDAAAVAYSVGPNVSAFIAKLWALVEDKTTDPIVHWSPNGKSFFIVDPQKFAKEQLPLFYKHNNISSFIRQLNMYGFRKVLSIEQGCMKGEADDMEFQHMFFIRDRPEQLSRIKRKTPSSAAAGIQSTAVRQEALLDRVEIEEKITSLETNLKVLQATQDMVNEQFQQLKRENTALWQELANQRQKHLKQQQVTYKLLQFIMHTVVPNRSTGPRSSRPTMQLGKRKYPALMENETANPAETPHSSGAARFSGPIISELPQRESSPLTDAARVSTPGPKIDTVTAIITSDDIGTQLDPSTIVSVVDLPVMTTAVNSDGSAMLVISPSTSAESVDSVGSSIFNFDEKDSKEPFLILGDEAAYIPSVVSPQTSALSSATNTTTTYQNYLTQTVSPGITSNHSRSLLNAKNKGSRTKGKKSEKSSTGASSSSQPSTAPPSYFDVNSILSPEFVKASTSGASSATISDSLPPSAFPDIPSALDLSFPHSSASDLLQMDTSESTLKPPFAVNDEIDDAALLLASSSPPQASTSRPQELALSLSKQIETVDQGLDHIKDALVSQTPGIQMDPSELLNLFVPDGPISTSPASPINWDDLLDFSASTKDALSQAFGPTKSILGPPDLNDDNSNS